MNKKESLKDRQLKILRVLSGEIDDFYLCGGTALSLFYFDHRDSEDLDFFTQKFSFERVQRIIEILKKKLAYEIELEESLSEKDRAKMMVFYMRQDENFIKIDFVEDVLPLIGKFKRIDDVNILSMEDIYIRKIYATSGLRVGLDEAGRSKFIGGRQEAKDLFDIFYLSKNFLSLSEFIHKYCDQALKEGVIRWFRRFNRLEMKIGLSEIKTSRKVEFRDIDKHFDAEIKQILLGEIGGI
ncbi:MAG: nucleotidyl transferase AbiEii/AbiGii toxin family protein [Candidatus Omnitrophota bacterium]